VNRSLTLAGLTVVVFMSWRFPVFTWIIASEITSLAVFVGFLTLLFSLLMAVVRRFR
jgi:hypothetical protein